MSRGHKLVNASKNQEMSSISVVSGGVRSCGVELVQCEFRQPPITEHGAYHRIEPLITIVSLPRNEHGARAQIDVVRVAQSLKERSSVPRRLGPLSSRAVFGRVPRVVALLPGVPPAAQAGKSIRLL